MFAALYLPPRPCAPQADGRSDRAFDPPPASDEPHMALLALAQAFVPRFEAPRPDLLLLDVSGLGRLLGAPSVIGDELRRAAADRGLRVHIALAATRTAAWLLAHARAGLTCLEPGGEAAALAPLPLDVLQALVRPPILRRGRARRPARPGDGAAAEFPLAVLRRWGLQTLGDLAALPPASLSARLGQAGLAWQRLAHGEELSEPLVPWAEETHFTTQLELEWPVEGLEPLAFVLGRLLEPLAVELEQRDRAAAAIHLRLGLVTKTVYERSLRLPAPIRDPRVLRTLLRLDLESHPPGAAIDTVEIRIEPSPGRIVQESLLERAQPAPEQLSTLLARLTALVGGDRCGTAVLVDSHRPGAFGMAPFAVDRHEPGLQGGERLRPCRADPSTGLRVALSLPKGEDERIRGEASASVLRGGGAPGALKEVDCLPGALRRFRRPVPARVSVEQGCPARVVLDRRGLTGGRVTRCAGPWRTSGGWWEVMETGPVTKNEERGLEGSACGPREARSRRARASGGGAPRAVEEADGHGTRGEPSWNRDEWEVAFADGVICRLFRDRRTERWFVDGVID